jgi:hypothetical protein
MNWCKVGPSKYINMVHVRRVKGRGEKYNNHQLPQIPAVRYVVEMFDADGELIVSISCEDSGEVQTMLAGIRNGGDAVWG